MEWINPLSEKKYKILHPKVNKEESIVTFELDGKKYCFDFTKIPIPKIFTKDDLSYSKGQSSGHDLELKLLRNENLDLTYHNANGVSAKASKIYSPMPGKIFKLLCSVGQKVEKDQVLVILEAMKMEHPIVAKGAGVIQKIHIKQGDIIGMQMLIIEFE